MQWLQETFNNLTTSETEGSREGSSAKAKSEPQKDGQLSREQLFDFFTKASKEMQAEEFRRKLKDARLLKQVNPPPCSQILFKKAPRNEETMSI